MEAVPPGSAPQSTTRRAWRATSVPSRFAPRRTVIFVAGATFATRKSSRPGRTRRAGDGVRDGHRGVRLQICLVDARGVEGLLHHDLRLAEALLDVPSGELNDARGVARFRRLH